MPIETILFVAAVVAAFSVLAGTLCWAERRTRNIRQESRQPAE